jgi:hypothetical protein
MTLSFMHNIIMPIRHVVLILSLRLLPFAVYGTCTWTPAWRRLWIAVAYLLLPGVACYLGAPAHVFLIGVGSLYYLIVCVGVYCLGNMVALGHVTRGAAFVALVIAFLLLPGVLLPGTAIVTFLVFGGELLLAAYSYCVETSRVGFRASVEECLFFLLVNPTVVYTLRGSLCTPDGLRGFRRAAGGVALMLTSALVWPLTGAVHGGPSLHALPAATTLALLLFGCLRFFAFYLMNAGLASVHIGLMHQMGWAVPERYRFPLAARNPMDFWRRWNTYVRVWLEAYVFLPTARHVARTIRPAVGPATAVAVTLAASGLLHDGFIFAGRQTFAGFEKTRVFLAAGALLGVWRVGRLVGETIGRHLDERLRDRFDLVARASARVGMLAALAGAAVLWG